MQLVSLLGSLGKSVKEAREMGRKFGVVEVTNGRKKGGYMNMSSGALDDVWEMKGDGGGSNAEGLSMEGGYVL